MTLPAAEARQKFVQLKWDLHPGKFHGADCSWEASAFSVFLVEKCWCHEPVHVPVSLREALGVTRRDEWIILIMLSKETGRRRRTASVQFDSQ